MAGTVAGLSAAALGLALNGRALLEMEPARIQLFLVVGPLLGLWPAALLSFVAARSPLVRRWTPASLRLWLGCGVISTVWFGVVPFLR
ncbi:MAG: hypothetical protein ACR2NO_07365 [Chloroflexota bacterium]